jgi:hypothetical protein
MQPVASDPISSALPKSCLGDIVGEYQIDKETRKPAILQPKSALSKGKTAMLRKPE